MTKISRRQRRTRHERHAPEPPAPSLTGGAFAAQRHCPLCAAPLAMRSRRDDPSAVFVACSSYPGCRFTTSADAEYQLALEEVETLTYQLEELLDIVAEVAPGQLPDWSGRR